MVKHIVMWRLHEHAEKAANAAKIKTTLEALMGKVPSLRAIEVGVHTGANDGASDVVLYSEFDDMEGLAVYQAHPDHQAVIPMMKTLCAERRVVDYEV